MVIIRACGKIILIIMYIITLLFTYNSIASGEDSFDVRFKGLIVTNGHNFISVKAPEAGSLTILVRDDYYTYRTIKAEITSGENEIEWDGCAWNSARLLQAVYRFECTLAGKSGREYFATFKASVARNAQYLQFVLPSANKVFLDEPDDWFIEVKSVLNGTLAFEIRSDENDQLLISTRKTLHQRRVENYTFTELTGKRKLDPGTYTVRVYEISRPDDIREFQINVEAESVSVPVSVTGEIIPPEGSDDSTIWEYMMKPSVVVDIDYTKSQTVYSAPDNKSDSFGTLHGQTQGVEVFEIQDPWAKIGAWNHEDGSYILGWVPLNRLKTVFPDDEYGLLVNKRDQTLTLFKRGVRMATMLVSTGRMTKNKLNRETSAGCFLTGLHRVDFSMQGNRYDYVIQYDGGNLLHQIPYTSDGKKDIRYGRAFLGSKASHACVRIQDTPCGEYGINAYWIWTHIPYYTRMIILDDPEERERTVSYLSGGKITDESSSFSACFCSPNFISDEQTINLTFAGDAIPGERIYPDSLTVTPYLKKNGYSYPFSRLKEFFFNDDMTCISMECTLKENNLGRDNQRKTVYRAAPECAEIFPAGSVELVCLANSHLMDFGTSGLRSTIEALAGKAETISTGNAVSFLINNHRIGFGGCTDIDYLSNSEIIEDDIRKLKQSGCEYIIYQCHWEIEVGKQRGSLQEAMACACQRAGANLVIGHGPSYIQGIDMLKDMPVIYSLGKILLGGSGQQRSYDALLVRVSISFQGKKPSAALKLIPVVASGAGKKNNYQPVQAKGDDRTRILGIVQADTVYDISGLSNGW